MNGFQRRFALAVRWLVIAALLGVGLSACSTGDDEGDEPTNGPESTETSNPTVLVGSNGTRTSSVSGQTISDGLCQALIPDGWVDDGTGRGATAGGHRFELFGARINSDAGWERAADVVATPTAGRSIASIDRTGDSVYAVYAGDLGFEFRKRFDSLYCDFSVTSASRPIAEADRASWPAVIESLAPAN